MTTTRNVTDTSDREILITRVLNAPRELVWEAITNPKHVVNWWGPRGFSSTIEQMDVRVGGLWKLVMHGPDGANYPNEHVFQELVKPERIVLAHSGHREDKPVITSTKIWTFETVEGGKTKVTMRMVFASPAECQQLVKEYGALEGGKQTLMRLAEHLDSMKASDRQIITSRIVSAPRELVWEAMTNPKHIVNWWGPRGFYTTIEKMDVRVGGEWKHVMHGPDGTNYPNHHVFKEIVKPERIVFSHGGHKEGGPEISAIATWTFETVEDGKTKVTISMEFPTAPERDFVVKTYGAIEGARQTLGRLDEFLPQLNTTTKTSINHPMTTTVNPYLDFNGRCDEALEFYKKAIDLKVTMLMRFKDSPDQSMVTPESKDKVMHVSCTVGGSVLMASDGHCNGNGKFSGINLSLNAPDIATAKKYFAALSQGGQVQMPLDKTFFSPAFGMLFDRFGVMWMVYVPAQQ